RRPVRCAVRARCAGRGARLRRYGRAQTDRCPWTDFLAGEPLHRGQRDRDPVGPGARLVDDFIDGLVGLVRTEEDPLLPGIYPGDLGVTAAERLPVTTGPFLGPVGQLP